MADTVVAASLTLDSSQANQSVKSFKTELKEATQSLIGIQDQFGETSKEAVIAAKRVAELKDKIGDAQKVASLFDPGAKFQAFTNVLRTTSAGFTALTGAAGLFGDQSKELQETLLKVQSAMALTEGLSALGEAGKDFAALKAVAVDAFKSIKAAIGSTGILLLVIALGTIYSYWDDIKEAVSGVNDEQKKLLEKEKEAVTAEQEKLDRLNESDNILKLQGKSERDILKLKIQQTDETIRKAKIELDSQKATEENQIKAASRNRELLSTFLDAITLPVNLLYKVATSLINNIIDTLNKIPGINISAKVDTKYIDELKAKGANYFFDPVQTKKDLEKTYKEQADNILKLQNQRAGYQLSIKDIDKKAGDDRKQLIKKQNEDELELHKQLHRDTLEAEIVSKNDILKEQDAKLQAQQKAANDKTKAQKDLIGGKNAGLQVGDDTQDIRADLAKERQNDFQNQLDELDVFYQKKFDLVKGHADLEKQLTEDKEKAVRTLERNSLDQRLEVTANVLGQLSDLFGKQTAAGKVTAIAEATINTYLAASKALTGIPKGNPFGAALAIAQAGIIIAAGIKNIREITKVKTAGGSSGSISSVSESAPAPLQVIPQQTNSVLPQDQINQIGNAAVPTRAYVLESDITGKQEQISRLNRAARLGG